MPEKSQKRKLRSDQSTSQFDIETASSINDENAVLSERDFEDISNKIENKISKRLRDTELNQREILKLIESLSSKVDNLSSVNSEQGYLTTRTENSGNPTEELEEVGLSRNESSNSLVLFCLFIVGFVYQRLLVGRVHHFLPQLECHTLLCFAQILVQFVQLTGIFLFKFMFKELPEVFKCPKVWDNNLSTNTQSF